MNVQQFLSSLGEVDARYLQDLTAQKKPRRRRLLIPLLAAIILLLSAGSVLAFTNAGTRLLEVFSLCTPSDFPESGYTVTAELTRIPLSALSPALLQERETIKEQIASYKPYDSRSPHVRDLSFDTAKEAVDFVGYDALTVPDPAHADAETTVTLLGDEDGNIRTVTLETASEQGDVRTQAFAYLFTEHDEMDITLRHATTEDVTFTESFYKTANGLTCQVLMGSAMASGYCGSDVYLVKGNVLYHLHTAYLETDEAQAQKIWQSWADNF